MDLNLTHHFTDPDTYAVIGLGAPLIFVLLIWLASHYWDGSDPDECWG